MRKEKQLFTLYIFVRLYFDTLLAPCSIRVHVSTSKDACVKSLFNVTLKFYF